MKDNKINLFNIEDYTINTADWDHSLHDSGVTVFEEEFAEYVGAKYACSISSATNAIFLIFLNHKVTVDIPSLIPPVVLNAIVNGGNKINFVDDVDWIGDSYILHKFDDCKIIDSAQKVEQNQFKKEANPEDLMLFSFYPTKPVGGLDGGMIVSDDLEKIQYFKEAVLNGMSYAKDNWNREIKFPGWKMYLNSFQASVAHQNLQKLGSKLERLEDVRTFYNSELGYKNTSSHLYRITVPDNKKAMKRLQENNIVSGIHYEPMHVHPVYRGMDDSYCPKSIEAAKTTLSIPFHEGLTYQDMIRVIRNIKEITG
tara:strand:- start:2078 stop:3013 length:936 start_codon:yes stop_codon:yes gene_type:complete